MHSAPPGAEAAFPARPAPLGAAVAAVLRSWREAETPSPHTADTFYKEAAQCVADFLCANFEAGANENVTETLRAELDVELAQPQEEGAEDLGAESAGRLASDRSKEAVLDDCPTPTLGHSDMGEPGAAADGGADSAEAILSDLVQLSCGDTWRAARNRLFCALLVCNMRRRVGAGPPGRSSLQSRDAVQRGSGSACLMDELDGGWQREGEMQHSMQDVADAVAEAVTGTGGGAGEGPGAGPHRASAAAGKRVPARKTKGAATRSAVENRRSNDCASSSEGLPDADVDVGACRQALAAELAGVYAELALAGDPVGQYAEQRPDPGRDQDDAVMADGREPPGRGGPGTQDAASLCGPGRRRVAQDLIQKNANDAVFFWNLALGIEPWPPPEPDASRSNKQLLRQHKGQKLLPESPGDLLHLDPAGLTGAQAAPAIGAWSSLGVDLERLGGLARRLYHMLRVLEAREVVQEARKCAAMLESGGGVGSAGDGSPSALVEAFHAHTPGALAYALSPLLEEGLEAQGSWEEIATQHRTKAHSACPGQPSSRRTAFRVCMHLSAAEAGRRAGAAEPSSLLRPCSMIPSQNW